MTSDWWRVLLSAGGGDINGPHLSVVTASAAAVLTLLKRLLNIVNIVTTQHTKYQVYKW